MGWLSRLFGLDRTPASRLARIVLKPSSYPREVVGESNYQAALETICGGYSRDGHDFECEAHLIPEPTNAYDPNAVQVFIDSKLVGYLSREDAVRFHKEMALAERSGQGVRCGARIKGGWRTNQHDQGHFGVGLAIPGRGRFTLA